MAVALALHGIPVMGSGCIFSGLVLLAIILCPGGSMAYVFSRTDGARVPLRWKDRIVLHLRADPRGSQYIEDGSDLEAVRLAAETWNRVVAHCSYIKFNIKAPCRSSWSENDDEVSVQWVKDWRGRTGMPDSMSAFAEVWAVDAPGELDDGAIVDADIWLNDQYYFSTGGEVPGIDLQSTMVHELGHVLGLDHPCLSTSIVEHPQPEDHLGRHLPRCDVAPETIRSSVMYPITKVGQRPHREPTLDDVAGVCANYPLHERPLLAEPTPLVGCNLGDQPTRPTTWLFPLLILLALSLLGRLR